MRRRCLLLLHATRAAYTLEVFSYKSFVALMLLACSAAGCLPMTSEAAFVGEAKEVKCDGVYPVCKGKSAGCILAPDEYLRGTFPGARKFLVETGAGDWKIRVLLFLSQRQSPGTETELWWYEPGCADQYHFQLSQSGSQDLFERAGRDQVFEVERSVREAGDHLVEIHSDATCHYAMRVEVVRQQ